MKTYGNLEKWLAKREGKIMFAHEKKDRDELQKTLNKLIMEQESIMTELHTVELLIDAINSLHKGKKEVPVRKTENLDEYKKWIKELKKSLRELSKKPGSAFTEEEKKFLEREKAKLEKEKEIFDKHLNELDKIIAKTKVLLIDLNETYCRDLSNGHSIASVGEVLKEKFGNKLEAGYSFGRWEMIKLLEKHFKIKRHEAAQILDLLIDSNIVVYKIEISNNFNELNFYTPFMDEFDGEVEIMNEPALGYWIINS